MARRSTRGRVVRAVILIAVVWAAVAAWLVVTAAFAARDGRDSLDALRERVSLESLLDGSTIAGLERARGHMDRAADRLGSPLVAPFKLLPFAGRQLRSFDALSSATARVLDVGVEAGTDLRERLDAPDRAGGERVALLRDLGTTAADLRDELAAVDLGPGDDLVAPLADARDEVGDRLDDLDVLLERARAVSVGLSELLQGPRRYLLLATNNAEMQAGAGMALSVGELTTDGGKIEVGNMAASSRRLPPPGAVVATGDLAERWPSQQPADDFRQLMLSPRFPPAAQLATQMWQALGNPLPDGVLAVDPLALRAILRGTGPVQADGRTVDAENVVPLILNEQYAAFGELGVEEVQATRRDFQEEATRAAVEALSESDVDMPKLVAALADAARARHFLAWSARPAEQASWEAARVDGELSDSSVMVSVINRGANKLDYFLRTEATLELRTQGTVVEGTVTVRVANRVGRGQPRYVVGPNSPDLKEGDYRGVVTVHLPGMAQNARIEGVDSLVVVGGDGPTRVVGDNVLIPRGQRRDLVVRFELPLTAPPVRVEPSARFPAVQWRAEGRSWNDGTARTVVDRAG